MGPEPCSCPSTMTARSTIIGSWPSLSGLRGHWDSVPRLLLRVEHRAFTVNPKKLETGLRSNSAGIPYTLLFRIEAIGFLTFGLLLYGESAGLRRHVSVLYIRLASFSRISLTQYLSRIACRFRRETAPSPSEAKKPSQLIGFREG